MSHIYSQYRTVLFIIFIFLGIRLLNLTSIPIYLDESLYLNWAMLIGQSEDYAYISMQEGKTPLFMWIASYTLKLFEDPLFSGRIISVVASLGTMLCFGLISWLLLGRIVAIIFMLLYTFLPWGFLIERLALVDSLLLFWSSLSLALLVGAINLKPKTKILVPSILISILSGVALGFGFYTKSSANIFLLTFSVIAISLCILNFKAPKKIIQIICTYCIFLFSYWQTADILRIGASRFWHMIAVKEKQLTFTPREFLDNPFNPIYLESLKLALDYFAHYYTILILPFLLIGIFAGIKHKSKSLIFVLYSFTIFAGIIFASHGITSRYLFIISPGIIVLTALGFKTMFDIYRKPSIVLLVIILVVWAVMDMLMAFNPKKAIMAQDDYSHLLASDVTGHGVKETGESARSLLKEGNVKVIVDMKLGQTEGIPLYLLNKESENELFIESYSNAQVFPKDIFEKSESEAKLFLIVNNGSKIEPILDNSNIQVIHKIERGFQNGKNSYAYVLMIPRK